MVIVLNSFFILHSTLANSNMEHRLVLNNRMDAEISNDDMKGIFHQCLKYYKFRRITTKTGKSIFYLFFRKEEDTYAALRASKAIKGISLVRYHTTNHVECELPFRPFPSDNIINICRHAFGKYLDRFDNVVWKENISFQYRNL